jgi:hypothetical protein
MADSLDHGDRRPTLYLGLGAPLSLVRAVYCRSLRCPSSKLHSEAASTGGGLLHKYYSHRALSP